jgi:hypothetical protein
MLLAAFVALAIWRLIRFAKVIMAKRPAGIAGGAGLLVPQIVASSQTKEESPGGSTSVPRSRSLLGALVGFGFWLVCNVVVVFILFGMTEFQTIPPLFLLVAAVLANFYLIPLARRLAEKWPSRAAG